MRRKSAEVIINVMILGVRCLRPYGPGPSVTSSKHILMRIRRYRNTQRMKSDLRDKNNCKIHYQTDIVAAKNNNFAPVWVCLLFKVTCDNRQLKYGGNWRLISDRIENNKSRRRYLRLLCVEPSLLGDIVIVSPTTHSI